MSSEAEKLNNQLNTLEKSRLKKNPKKERPTRYLDTSNYKLYYSEEEQNFHKEKISQLFEWNFGKDWKIYLLLEYSLVRGYHNVRYNTHHPDEDLSVAFVMRQAHFAKAKLLLHNYLTKGFESTQSIIRLNQLRIIWRGQYWVSSQIVNKVEERKQEALRNGDNPDNGPLPIIAIENADGLF